MYRPRPSSPELFNKDHNAGRESLSHLDGLKTRPVYTATALDRGRVASPMLGCPYPPGKAPGTHFTGD